MILRNDIDVALEYDVPYNILPLFLPIYPTLPRLAVLVIFGLMLTSE